MSDTRDSHVLYLRCLQGKQRGQRFRLEPGHHVQIGRDPGEAGIAIHDLLASRHHAEVLVADAHLDVQDLKSANGTRINGRPVIDKATLHPGDILTIGHCSLVLEDPRIHVQNEVNEGTRSLRKRQSARVRKQLQRTRAAPATVEALGISGGTEAALLATLLSTLPMAMLLFDADDRILTANQPMRTLCALPLEPGHDATGAITVLASQLQDPDELAAVLGSKEPGPARLELRTDSGFWLAWHHHQDHYSVLFLLDDTALGGAAASGYNRSKSHNAPSP